MSQIACPQCGHIIDVDPSQLEDLSRQLRDELFERDLAARLEEAGHVHEAKLEAARLEERSAADKRLAESQSTIDGLEARLEAAGREQELAVQKAREAAAQEREKLQRSAAEAALVAEREEAALRQQIAQLTATLAGQEAKLKAEGDALLAKKTAELNEQVGALEAKIELERAGHERSEAALKEEMARRQAELVERTDEQLRAKDELLAQRTEEIERLRDYRVRLSTKLIGESLERHCEAEFNRIRMQAYPHASFEKDNDASQATKGDFIFRDYDEEGNELLSIMFEMKNEEENSKSTSRKRNEDHFKKLDADRNKKGCEYAVLVSTLEADNDFYNAGIADVSWRYPKMFVVRPQCFTTIIGLLKASALAAHTYRLQLERSKREELDVTRFEERLGTIVSSIQSDYEKAARNYDRAEADIDAIIKKLEDLKKQLRTASGWFSAAQKQSEKLTVKRLTHGNPTMRKAFEQARENTVELIEESSEEPENDSATAEG